MTAPLSDVTDIIRASVTVEAFGWAPLWAWLPITEFTVRHVRVKHCTSFGCGLVLAGPEASQHREANPYPVR